MSICYNNKCKAENPENATWCIKCNSLLSLAKRYKTTKFIAQGAMGHVYLAEDQQTQSPVVIKVLKTGSSERFSEEARLGKRAHENKTKHLVHTLDVLDLAGTKFIVQNYIEGKTLAEILKDQNDLSLPFSRKLSIAVNYAAALEELRHMEIVHRDLKPENTMIGDNNHVTILDFGLAKDDYSLTLTTMGEVMGTYYYIAPESLESCHNANFSADIFSFGVILYEIFHGKNPHDFSLVTPYFRQSDFIPKLQKLKKYTHINPIFIGASPEIKTSLTTLVMKCLKPDPEERCSSAFLSKTLNNCVKIYDEYITQKIKDLPKNNKQILYGLHKIPYVSKHYSKSNKLVQNYIHTILGQQERSQNIQQKEKDLQKTQSELQRQQKELKDIETKLKLQKTEQEKIHQQLQLQLSETTKKLEQYEYANQKHSVDLCKIEKLEAWLKDTTYWNGNTICKADYHGYLKNDLPHGNGKCDFYYGGKLQFLYKRVNLSYEGEWKNGLPNGHGKFCWITGEEYQGDVQDGKCNGRGTFNCSNKSCYIGQWKDNKKHGWGTYTWGELDSKKAGDKYTGQYDNDVITGHGTLTFANGEKYIGEFVNGGRTGHGTYIWTNSEKYVGEFHESKRTGQGTYLWPNNDKYVGQFLDGKRTGYGTFTSHNGEKYIGEFKDEVKNGKGTLLWPNGNTYEGEFQHDKPNGQGTFKWKDGSKYVGEFKDGEKNGDGTFIWTNRDKYEGKFKDDKKNGQGTFMLANGNIYIGKFKDDQKNGHGTFMWANGDKYVGKFKDDQKNGHGIVYNPDETIKMKGIWENDTYTEKKTKTFF